MSPRLRLIFTLGTGLVLGIALSLAGRVVAERAGPAEPPLAGKGAAALPWQDARLLAEVLQRVRENYVDPVDDHQLMSQAAHGMVEALDEHSELLEPDDFADLQDETSGSYAGIGVEVEGAPTGLRIVRCLPGSPALAAGLRGGDLIVRIDALDVTARNIDAATERLRGDEGSKVRLAVRRGSAPPAQYLLERSQVALASVSAETLAPGIAYLRLSEFTDATATELEQSLAAQRAQANGHLKGLVIDLRNNPGGVLESATAIADDFLERGTIVSAEGRASEARFKMVATPGDIAAGAPIVVLVNGGSASAAEILAAALRQNGRATLVGRKTYGKGTVQTIMPLSTGQALKITTSRYYTPAGTSINGIGLTPDIVLTGEEQQPADLDAAGAAATLATRDAGVGVALATLRGAHYASGSGQRGRHHS